MFTTKIRNQTYPPLVFNNSYVEQFATQKHLELILDSKPNLQENLENVFKTANKSIALIRKFQIILTRPPLITIDKSFVRPYLDYLVIKQITLVFTGNWNQFSTMLPLTITDTRET